MSISYLSVFSFAGSSAVSVWLLLKILVFCLVTISSYGCLSSVGEVSVKSPASGKESSDEMDSRGGASSIPDVVLEKVDGSGAIGLRNLAKGKVLIIVFWATWCDSCKNELVFLKTLYKRYSSRGMEILSISIDTSETAGEALSILRKYSIDYPSVFDTDNLASQSLNPTGSVPYTVIIDRSARVVYRKEGFFSGDIERIKAIAVKLIGE